MIMCVYYACICVYIVLTKKKHSFKSIMIIRYRNWPLLCWKFSSVFIRL